MVEGKSYFSGVHSRYRAEIRLNGRLVITTDGRHMLKEQIEKFITEHWPGDLKWHKVEDQKDDELSLRVIRYGVNHQIIINAKMAKPEGWRR